MSPGQSRKFLSVVSRSINTQEPTRPHVGMLLAHGGSITLSWRALFILALVRSVDHLKVHLSWESDAVHSQASFAVHHLMVCTVPETKKLDAHGFASNE